MVACGLWFDTGRPCSKLRWALAEPWTTVQKFPEVLNCQGGPINENFVRSARLLRPLLCILRFPLSMRLWSKLMYQRWLRWCGLSKSLSIFNKVLCLFAASHMCFSVQTRICWTAVFFRNIKSQFLCHRKQVAVRKYFLDYHKRHRQTTPSKVVLTLFLLFWFQTLMSFTSPTKHITALNHATSSISFMCL